MLVVFRVIKTRPVCIRKMCVRAFVCSGLWCSERVKLCCVAAVELPAFLVRRGVFCCFAAAAAAAVRCIFAVRRDSCSFSHCAFNTATQNQS